MYEELHAKLEEPCIYGPITDEEFNLIPVPHRMTYLNGDRYIGVKNPLDMFESKRIQSF
jgi:hypothetical protein